MSTSDMSKILDFSKAYVNALYHADSVAMEVLFHPDAKYVNMNEGGYLNYSRAEYVSTLKKRHPPSTKQSSLDEKVISLHLGGDTMAFVELSMIMMERQYLDYLTLIKVKDEWVIMNKAFLFTPVITSTY